MGHTWHEGIHACKSWQFQSAVDQQLNASQPKVNASSDIVNMDSEVATTMGIHMFESKPVDALISMPAATLTNVTCNTSIITPAHNSVVYGTSVTTSKATNAIFTNIMRVTRMSILFIIDIW